MWSILCRSFITTMFLSRAANAYSQSQQQSLDLLNNNDMQTMTTTMVAAYRFIGIDVIARAREACRLSHIFLSNSSLGSDIIPQYISPQSATYTNRTQIHWCVFDTKSSSPPNSHFCSHRSNNCWQNSSCIVSPTNTQELVRIMAIIRSTQATFSVRSGGHDFNINHSSVDQSGILIDMVNFNRISLSLDKSTLTAGVGARWGAVYRALNGTGVSVNGAKSPNPGVGGQTLGGGNGWFSNLAGATAASVAAAEIVLANSSVVKANEESNRELFWALRGGGPNFGIVTSFTYKTYPVDKMWFEARLYTSDKNQELLNALVEYQNLAENDTKCSIVYSLSADSSAPQSFVGFLYLDPIEHPAIFSPFYRIKQAKNMTNSTIGTIADLSSKYNNRQYPDPGTRPSR